MNCYPRFHSQIICFAKNLTLISNHMYINLALCFLMRHKLTAKSLLRNNKWTDSAWSYHLINQMVTILKSLCCDFYWKKKPYFAHLQKNTREDLKLAVSNLWWNKQEIRWINTARKKKKKISPNSPGNLEMQGSRSVLEEMVCL